MKRPDQHAQADGGPIEEFVSIYPDSFRAEELCIKGLLWLQETLNTSILIIRAPK